jgi:hypothetical protein
MYPDFDVFAIFFLNITIVSSKICLFFCSYILEYINVFFTHFENFGVRIILFTAPMILLRLCIIIFIFPIAELSQVIINIKYYF